MEFYGLLCDEDLPATPTSCPSNPPPCRDAASAFTFVTAEERDEALKACLQKQHSYMPVRGYVDCLRRSPRLMGFRYKAVRWIISAGARLSFSHVTVFCAVNYLDRFASLFCHMEWECWMMELLAVASLAIAAKLEEISVPPLQAFPMEDLDHSYKSCTIQRMEVVVLRALDWRLHCVTPFTYVGMLLRESDLGACFPHLAGELAARVTDLLLAALLDFELLDYSQFILAASAVRRGIGELVPLATEAPILASVGHLVPKETVDEMERCNMRMGVRASDPLYASMVKWGSCCPSSPVTVIRPLRRRLEVSDRHFDLEHFFDVLRSGDDLPSYGKRQKRF